MLRLVVPAVIASFAGAITISRKPEYQADHYNFGQITGEAVTKDEDKLQDNDLVMNLLGKRVVIGGGRTVGSGNVVNNDADSGDQAVTF